jgi:protein TonB
MPRKALREGVSGTVRANIKVVGGQVVDVAIVSGPQIFHESVTKAIYQYKCISLPEEAYAVQEFVFVVEDSADIRVRYSTRPNGPIFRVLQTGLGKISFVASESTEPYASPTCRASPNKVIDLNGRPPSQMVSDAINLELTEANSFSAETVFRVSVDAIDFSSAFKGYWDFKVTVMSPSGERVAFESRRTFETDLLSASKSCYNGTKAFIPGVQDLILNILSSSEFRRLVVAKSQPK